MHKVTLRLNPNLRNCSDNSASANRYTTFYVDKIASLSERFDNHTTVDSSVAVGSSSPDPLGVATVKTILKRISSSKSCGLHGIPATVWKRLLLSLAVPLMHMVNASFEQCRVPALFKVAKVIPVYKGRQSPGRRPLRTD